MIRILFALILTAGASSVHASGWPWQKQTDESLAYCQGFVVGGLASSHMEGVSRTDLWLAWNYIIRSGQVDPAAASDEFNAGRDKMSPAIDAAAQQASLEEAYGSCGLGRSGHQVTGW